MRVMVISSSVGVGVRARAVGGALPWPAAFEFEREAPAQERADRHDQREHDHAVHRRRERDGLDDVGGDEHLEPEQDRAAHVVA